MNTKVMFSSNNSSWVTPQGVYEKLHREFCFTLDPCATKENAKCKKYFTEKKTDSYNHGTGKEFL